MTITAAHQRGGIDQGKGGKGQFPKRPKYQNKNQMRYQKPKKIQPSPTRREGQSLFVANREEKGKANQRRILCHVLPPHLPPPPSQDKKTRTRTPHPTLLRKNRPPFPPHTPQNAIRYMCIYGVVVLMQCMHALHWTRTWTTIQFVRTQASPGPAARHRPALISIKNAAAAA